MSGNRANGSGKLLHGQVSSALDQCRIGHSTEYVTGWMSVLGKVIRSDVYVPRCKGFPCGLHIEVRRQEEPGTVDEKICYLYQNIIESYERPAVVVIDGNRIDAQYEYLKARVDGKKLIGVFLLMEFLLFCEDLAEGSITTPKRECIPEQGRLFV